MTVLLLTGIAEELRAILKHWQDSGQPPFAFSRAERFYHCQRPGHDFFAGTTGPGLQKPGKLLRQIERIQPDLLVLAGLVGILRPRSGWKVGQELKVGLVKSQADSTVFPGGPGSGVLVTVPEPVFAAADKYDLARKYGADFCDMEASRLLTLCGRSPAVALKTRLVLLKNAGDLPEQADLYQYEAQYRRENRQAVSQSGRFSDMIRWWRYRKLAAAKKAALNGLAASASRLLLTLPERSDLLDRHSVFFAHVR